MLTRLCIQNVVLIEKLEIEVLPGFLALTGETGAGKSILLDALCLGLGMRADAGKLRQGCDQASVAATFDLLPESPVLRLLDNQGIPPADDSIILRRTLGRDGKSRAFVNDTPVSVTFLREVGAALVEIHGQFETQGLLSPSEHRRVLDAFAGIENEAADVARLWNDWRASAENLQKAKTEATAARAQEDWLRHVVAELDRLAPQIGEETALAEQRIALKNKGKIAECLSRAQSALEDEGGAIARATTAQGALERLTEHLAEQARPALDHLSAAQDALAEALAAIESMTHSLAQPLDAQSIDERYFSLKECARKHNCAADDLPALHRELAARLDLVVESDNTLGKLEDATAKARNAYVAAADKLGVKRKTAAARMEKSVMKELPPLKMQGASFQVAVEQAGEPDWGPAGTDSVRFLVATNPGIKPGPIDKVASGGELARLMLAIKVVLAATGQTPTLIFDEVDSGVGGGTADAVGERLSKLGKSCQVLVVTHSPQVAARADHHWTIAKTGGKTGVTSLDTREKRREEIARMLSGSDITTEARAAALRLLEHHDAAA